MDGAERRELFDLAALRAVVRAHRGRPGAPLLAAVLGEHVVGSTLTRSELEETFLALCDSLGPDEVAAAMGPLRSSLRSAR